MGRRKRERIEERRDEIRRMRDEMRSVIREARDYERNKPREVVIKPLTEQGEKMAEIVKNIASESEIFGYNPEKDANWDLLPMEMRAECIDRMDFKTRIEVSKTSTIERSLVCARKSYFPKLLIETKGYLEHDDDYLPPTTNSSIYMELVKPDPLSPGGMERSDLDGESLSSHEITLLKNCEFGEIRCFAFGNQQSQQYDLKECAPFRFKSLKAKGGNLYMAAFFLLNSAPGVENIELNVEYDKDFSIADYSKIPSFIKAKRIVVEHMTFEKLLKEAKKLAEKWSEDDVEIGTKCHFNSGSTKELITGKTKKKMTISMQNESKIVSIIFNFDMELRQGDVEACVMPKSE